MTGLAYHTPHFISNDERDINISTLCGGPKDSISHLSFSPTANTLAVSSWDKTIYLYEIGSEGQAFNRGSRQYQCQCPQLCVCWKHDGSVLFSGGTDHGVQAMDYNTNAVNVLGHHEGGVRCMRWTDIHGGLLVSGGWDSCLKFWDLRSPACVLNITLNERCYSLDIAHGLLVAATAERKIHVMDLKDPRHSNVAVLESPLKHQTRSVACFPDAKGFALGSTEGRVAIHYLQETEAKRSFSFKCHRTVDGQNPQASSHSTGIHAVNSVSFHPLSGSLVTSGSDGTMTFWDTINKSRLKTYNVGIEALSGGSKEACPVVATAFNHIAGSRLLAYGLSDDWSRGSAGGKAMHRSDVMMHVCKDEALFSARGTAHIPGK